MNSDPSLVPTAPPASDSRPRKAYCASMTVCRALRVMSGVRVRRPSNRGTLTMAPSHPSHRHAVRRVRAMRSRRRADEAPTTARLENEDLARPLSLAVGGKRVAWYRR